MKTSTNFPRARVFPGLLLAAVLALGSAQAAPTLSNALVFSHKVETLEAAPTQAADGNYYGVCPDTGNFNAGAILRITPAGVVTTLYSFPPGSDPSGRPLAIGPDGALYGVTYSGGTNDGGTLFRLTTGGVFTTVVNFGGAAAPQSFPYGGLLLGADGAFYGLCSSSDEEESESVIFKYAAATGLANVATFTDPTMGYPRGDGLVADSAGAIYGLTDYYDNETFDEVTRVFRYRASDGLTTAATLSPATFRGAYYGITIGADGRLYGPAYDQSFNDVIFVVNPATGIASILATLDYSTTGSAPRHLVAYSDGFLYGVTNYGGSQGGGTAFKVSTAGAVSVVRAFSSNPAYPTDIALNGAGNFIGVSQTYGSVRVGSTIFTLARATGATASLATLSYASNGRYPQPLLAPAADGGLYGVTSQGGSSDLGTVFHIAPGGQVTTESNFLNNSSEYLAGPQRELVSVGDGTYLGVTYDSIYRFTPGSGVSEMGPAGGIGPNIDSFDLPVRIPGGYLFPFGEDYDSDNYDGGIAFLSNAGGLAIWAALDYATTGSSPQGPLVLGPDGNYYGAAGNGGANESGTLFKLTPQGALSLAATFDRATTGGFPNGPLALASDGNFYGVTSYSGADYEGSGTLFRFNPIAGTLTKLADFDAATTGSAPAAGLSFGADGALYGATGYDGPKGGGTLFRATLAGQITVLAALDSAANGDTAGVVTRTADGSLYVAARYGGPKNSGAILKFGSAPVTPPQAPATSPALEAPKVAGKPKIAGNKATLTGKSAAGTTVEYAAGKGKFKRAKSKGGKWTITVKLQPGKNVISIRTVDPRTGKVSATKKVVVKN